MLYEGKFGKSLVSEEFAQMCIDMGVEAQVTPLPNPGNIFKAARIIKFRNFRTTNAKIIQYNKRKTVSILPAKGTIEIMLTADEQLPKIEKEE